MGNPGALWETLDFGELIILTHRRTVPGQASRQALCFFAKTYKANYDLQLQLNVGGVTQDYVVICHGWMSLELWEITVRVYWIKDSNLPS